MTTVVDPEPGAAASELDRFVEHTTKVLRIASAIIAVDAELDGRPINRGTCRRLARLERRLLIELASALSDDGQEELAALVRPPDENCATEQEVRVGFAQLAGWVRGLEEAAERESYILSAGGESES